MEFYTHVTTAGNKIICRGYRDGKRFKEIVSYKPYLFIPNKGEKDEGYRTIFGEPVGKLDFEDIKEARSFIEEYRDTDFKYYGITFWNYTFLNDRFPGRMEFDPNQLSIGSLDIEVATPKGFPNLLTADQPITAITLTKKGRAITFGLKPYETKSDNHKYYCAKDEADLLKVFLEVWDKNKYWKLDIVTGWSVEEFDIPYIVRRIGRVLDDDYVKKLSPNRWVAQKEKTMGKTARREARQVTVYDLSGISILDYKDLYERYKRESQESYSLDNIAKVEKVGEKTKYEGTLEELYHEDFETFIDYNLNDAFLVEKLENKLNYLQLVIRIAYRAKINFSEALSTARPWDILIHNHLLDRKIVVPPTQDVEDTGKIRGAFVKEVVPGMYKWVVSVDFDSLYPRLISGQNISNETLVDLVRLDHIDDILKKGLYIDGFSAGTAPDYTICINGALYRKDVRGFLPELVDQFIQERVDAKNKMKDLKKLQQETNDPVREIQIGHLNSFQESWKILTNGLFGALAMRYFRWYDIRLAEAITMTGQYSVRRVLNTINAYLNTTLKTKDKDFIIAADTDSCYINLEELVNRVFPVGAAYTTEQKVEFVDKVMKEKLNPLIKKTCDEITAELNAYAAKLNMKQEIIADRAVWRAKKNYILNVWDDEGIRYKEAKIKMKGIETVRASTPMACRDAIKKCIKILMNNEEKDLQDYVAEFKAEFMKLPFEQISFPRSVNGIEKYWDEENYVFRPKTPPNVRGSVAYNNMLKELKLTGKYHIIRDKDKIKWAWLKKPNPLHSTVIAVFDELPKEFGLESYIDYGKQFEKTFRHPVETIVCHAGWNTNYTPTLAKFWKPFKEDA